TKAPFRLVCRECGAGPLTSEEIAARALVHGNARTGALARHLAEERPLAMQLLGADPDVLAEAARRLEAAGADAIDLNMGCPVAKIVAKGQGAALMRDPWRAAMIFRAVRKAVTVPLTAKIRGGWDERAPNAVEIARVAEAGFNRGWPAPGGNRLRCFRRRSRVDHPPPLCADPGAPV